MPLTKGRAKWIYDAAADVELRNIGDGAEVATAAEAAISLNTLSQAEWDENEIPFSDRLRQSKAVIHVSAVDTADGDETYVITLEVADDEAFTTNVVEIATHTVLAAQQVGLALDPQTIVAASAGAPAYLRVKATLSGTSPSITYGAWLV